MNATTRDGAAFRTGQIGIATVMILAMLMTLSLPRAALADTHQPPDGHHDANEGLVNGNHCFASGWAVDPDDTSARLEVRISLNGAEVATVVADDFRSDLADLGISDGFSGWTVDLLGIAVTDVTYDVLAEARDAQTGVLHALGSSPKSLTCGNATPIGFHDGNEGTVATYDCVAFGWTVDRDDLTARLEVRVLVDGTEVTSGTADLLREDLIASGDSPDGLAGFVFDLRDLVQPVVSHEVIAQARDAQTGEWVDLAATPRQLQCADDPATNPFAGTWTALDLDGSTETMTVSASPGGMRISYRDDFATICADAGARVTVFHTTGSARLLGPDLMEVDLDDARCGSYVVPIDWPIHFEYLAGSDELSDGLKLWTRSSAAHGSADAGGLMDWHRLNPFAAAGGSEHERLSCLAGQVWTCRYDKLPEPALELSWDRTRGEFAGASGAPCPSELGELCDRVVEVVAGTARYTPEDGDPFAVQTQLLMTDADGVAPLYVYWVGQFACPWHATFDEALEAPSDCILPDVP